MPAIDTQQVNREPCLIDEHKQGTTFPSPTLVTPMQMTSRRREVDTYADIPSMVTNSSISGCVESVIPECVVTMHFSSQRTTHMH